MNVVNAIASMRLRFGNARLVLVHMCDYSIHTHPTVWTNKGAIHIIQALRYGA